MTPDPCGRCIGQGDQAADQLRYQNDRDHALPFPLGTEPLDDPPGKNNPWPVKPMINQMVSVVIMLRYSFIVIVKTF